MTGCCNAYESESMQKALGKTLRPGGFSLTEKGVRLCSITPDDKVLDLGCGRGATVNYLCEKHGIRAFGVDASPRLLEEAKKLYGPAGFFLGKGEAIPFADKSFDCVFAECTLSLMDTAAAVKEVGRVLKDNGRFVVSDVYARNPEELGALNDFSINSCMRGLHDLKELEEQLKKAGLSVSYFEDCSFLLKELLVKITFAYGSMSAFWSVTSHDCIDGCDFYGALKKCKPGYFMLVAEKGGAANG